MKVVINQFNLSSGPVKINFNLSFYIYFISSRPSSINICILPLHHAANLFYKCKVSYKPALLNSGSLSSND